MSQTEAKQRTVVDGFSGKAIEKDVAREAQFIKPSEKWDTSAHQATVAAAHPWPLIPIAIGGNAYALYTLVAAAVGGTLDWVKLGLILTIMFFYIDIISGLLHLVLDNPKFLHTPGLTKLAEGFQQHHTNTNLIIKMRLRDHLRPMCTPIVAVAAIGGLYHGFANHGQCAFLIGMSGGVVWMQCCHRWSHMLSEKERGPLISRIQRMGLALPPHVHLKHHTPPYMHTFCIMSGVFNPALNWVVASHPMLNPHCRIWLPIFLSALVSAVIGIPMIA